MIHANPPTTTPTPTSPNHNTLPKNGSYPQWIVYPPPPNPSPTTKHIYLPGDRVFLRPKSCKERDRIGTIVAMEQPRNRNRVETTTTTTAAGDEGRNGKVRVRFPILPRSKQQQQQQQRRRRPPQERCAATTTTAITPETDPNDRKNGTDPSTTNGTTTTQQRFYETNVRPERLVPLFRPSTTIQISTSTNNTPNTPNTPNTHNTLGNTNNNDNDTTTNTVRIIVTERTDQYRILASTQTTPHDRILEIGCSNGGCSRILAKRLLSENDGDGGTHTHQGRLVGFDTSLLMIQQANESWKQEMDRMRNEGEKRGKGVVVVEEDEKVLVGFYKVDPFTDPKRALLLACGGNHGPNNGVENHVGMEHKYNNNNNNNPSSPPNVVFVDIGGNRDLESVVRMVSWVLKSFFTTATIATASAASTTRPGLVVVKSEEMVRVLLNETEGTLKDEDTNKDTDDGGGGGVGGIGEPVHKRAKPYPATDTKESQQPSSSFFQKKRKGRLGEIPNGNTWFERIIRSRIKCQHQSNSYSTNNNGGTREDEPVVPCTPNDGTQPSDTNNNHYNKPRTNGGPPLYRHPLRAPMAVLPVSSTNPKDGTETTTMVPICRYHNYHIDGCRKGDDCPFDHTACHWCLQKGHVARSCRAVGPFTEGTVTD